MTSDGCERDGFEDPRACSRRQTPDVNVFDLDRVTQLSPEIVHNFPGAAPQFTPAGARHKARHIVNGQIKRCDRRGSTGARAGQVLRHVTDAVKQTGRCPLLN